MYIVLAILLAIFFGFLHAFKPLGKMRMFGKSNVNTQSNKPLRHEKEQKTLTLSYFFHNFFFLLLIFLSTGKGKVIAISTEIFEFYIVVICLFIVANFGMWLSRKIPARLLKIIFSIYNVLCCSYAIFLLVAKARFI